MRHLLQKIHLYWYLSCVFFFFIIFFPYLYFITRNPEKNYNKIVCIRRLISVLGAGCAGIFFKVTYEEHIDWKQPYVICPNHTSILDITALTYLCPQPFSFMGKIELLKNPVTRIFFKTIDITVDRNSKMSAFRAFKKADQYLKEGKSIVIFPEGKIDDEYPPRLHEFKSGSFRLAVDNQIPILPIVIEDAWHILWDGGEKYGSRPGIVHIKILAPIDTSLLKDEDFEKPQELVFDRMTKYLSQN